MSISKKAREFISKESNRKNIDKPVEDKKIESETVVAASIPEQDAAPEPVVVEKKMIVDNSKLNINKKVDDHPKIENGGLEGNPGQMNRFNSVMQNKSSDVSKYFSSGKNG